MTEVTRHIDDMMSAPVFPGALGYGQFKQMLLCCPSKRSWAAFRQHAQKRLVMVSLGRFCAPMQRILPPSVADFHRFFVRPMMPVVLEGVASEWPAIFRWSDDSYLHSTAGDAHVDVEVGRNFLDPELMQQRSTLSNFMRQHLHDHSATRSTHPEAQCLGYVAHYDLFAAAPQLRRDIFIPAYVGSNDDGCDGLSSACGLSSAAQCEAGHKFTHYHSMGRLAQHALERQREAGCSAAACMASNVAVHRSGDIDPTQLFAWFGPSGTYSPLHHDPWHNILVQVVGSKRVHCYAPCATPALYPFPVTHDDGLRTNCSTIMDHDSACPVAFPLFSSAPCLEAVLQPGDGLFIPKQHWHAVRALTSSFSVNFWW